MSESVTIFIAMDYPGAAISKNHSFRGGSRRSGYNKVAKAWKDTLAEGVRYALLGAGVPVPAPPVALEISGAFVDRSHAPDTQNIVELIADAVQAGTGLTDRDYTITTRPPQFGAVIPSITVKVTVGLGEGS